MQRVPMTKQGAESLRQELAWLKSGKRHQIVAAIEEARAHGDLSENAEYHAAKEEQGMNESRIATIEDRLGRAQIIDPATIDVSNIVFGAKVSLLDLDKDTAVHYFIVGENEANISEGKISITSPIARALIGKEEGDVATVHAPSGDREYEIIEVRYG